MAATILDGMDFTQPTMQDTDSLPGECSEKDTPRERPKLCGAARKRLKWLIARGQDPEQARTMAIRPIKELKESSKRSRSDGSTPETQGTKKRRIRGAETMKGQEVKTGKVQEFPAGEKAPPPPSYKQILTGTRMGILPVNFPEEMLSADQAMAAREAILDLIVVKQGCNLKPTFHGVYPKPGWLMVHCTDDETVEWLKLVVSDIKPWEGAVLQAVDEEHIPRPKILVGYFPECLDLSSERILNYIGAQNHGLKVAEWKVIRRVVEGTSSQLTLSVDHLSAERLKKASFKIGFRFGHVQLRPKGMLLREAGTSGSKTAAGRGARVQKPGRTPGPKASAPRASGSGVVPSTSAAGVKPSTAPRAGTSAKATGKPVPKPVVAAKPPEPRPGTSTGSTLAIRKPAATPEVASKPPEPKPVTSSGGILATRKPATMGKAGAKSARPKGGNKLVTGRAAKQAQGSKKAPGKAARHGK